MPRENSVGTRYRSSGRKTTTGSNSHVMVINKVLYGPSVRSADYGWDGVGLRDFKIKNRVILRKFRLSRKLVIWRCDKNTPSRALRLLWLRLA